MSQYWDYEWKIKTEVSQENPVSLPLCLKTNSTRSELGPNPDLCRQNPEYISLGYGTV